LIACRSRSFLNFSLQFLRKSSKKVFDRVIELFGWGIAFESIDHIDKRLIGGAQVTFMLILGLFSCHHHRLGFSCSRHREIAGGRCLTLMFVLNVSVKSGVAEVPFTADADIVTFHGVVSGTALSSRLELLLTLVVACLLDLTH
jgi:hypothetical protein